jgi:molybdopterin molybdotransferase
MTAANDALGAEASCLDDYDPNSLSAEQALARMLAAVAPIDGIERIALRSALGRALALDVRSRIDVPGHTNSAMDGYALRSEDLTSAEPAFTVIGTALAGKPYLGTVGRGECVRIMTGGVMPDGTDAVVAQERARRDGDRMRVSAGVDTGGNVRAAGEDIRAGQVVLHAGRRLRPADLGLLASLGIVEVPVRRRLRVAFFSTGDELRSLGEALGPGDVYDSNRYTLHGMLTELGAEVLDLGVVPDVRTELKSAFAQAGQVADVVITSGGVSVGEADFVKEILAEVGSIQFWKVAMKPGRPLAFGRIGTAVFFGLPGNPVSVMVTFYLFVQVALRRMMGEDWKLPAPIRATCSSKLKKRPGRIEYQRGIIEPLASGGYTVRKTGAQGSGILTSMSEANCFIVLPVDGADVAAGANVDVLPFHALF